MSPAPVSLAVSVMTGVLFGVVPALTASRVHVRDALQDSTGHDGGGERVRGLFVGAEVAVAVVLLL